MQIEVRQDGSVFITGYVNCTGKESHFISSSRGRFKEVIEEGAFTAALQRAKNVDLLFNHDRKLGSIKDGNLSLVEDAIGLRASCEVRDAAIVEKAKQKNFLHGWSFGFCCLDQKFERDKSGYEKRYVKKLDLLEVSLIGGISKPAYPATSIVEVRSGEDILLERRYSDFEIERSNIDFALYDKKIRYLKLKGLKL